MTRFYVYKLIADEPGANNPFRLVSEVICINEEEATSLVNQIKKNCVYSVCDAEYMDRLTIDNYEPADLWK